MTTDTITSDSVASVSLTDADRDPDAFARELGESFVDYGFAILRDHGIPQQLIDRAEELSKQFFALPEEVKRKYLIEGSGGARGYTAFGIETAKGADGAATSRNSGTSGASLPRGIKYPRGHGRQCVARPKSPDFKRHLPRSYTTRSTQAGLKILARDRALPQGRRGLFRRHRARRQFGHAAASITRRIDRKPTGNHIRAGAHEDINTITLADRGRGSRASS